jgi:hypothetical protein
VSNDKTPTQRVVLALQAAGLSPAEARAAMNEVKAHLYSDLYDELRIAAERKNPYRLNRARVKWHLGLNKAMELVFRRMLQAETAVRSFRNTRKVEVW